jgi:hypothetical protein
MQTNNNTLALPPTPRPLNTEDCTYGGGVTSRECKMKESYKYQLLDGQRVVESVNAETLDEAIEKLDSNLVIVESYHEVAVVEDRRGWRYGVRWQSTDAARLKDAAPDLLEACKAAQSWLMVAAANDPGAHDKMNQVDAAIAKAEKGGAK